MKNKYKELNKFEKLIYKIINRNKQSKNDFLKKFDFPTYIDLEQAYNLHQIVNKLCSKRKGNIAEVGVCGGSSAKVICNAKKDNHFYLFDCFGEFPEDVDDEEERFRSNNYTKFTLDIVKNYLKEYSNLHFIKGYFPESIPKELYEKKFMFVHLDVDLVESTKECLKFFYERMEKGGIIITHDYIGMPKCKEVYDNFFKDKPEIIIELNGCQAVIVKC